jgi:hypothetical protein
MTQPKPPKPGSIFWLIQTPGPRTYLIMGVASLLVYYLIMSQRGGELGSALIVIVGLPGLLAGWVISPAMFILLSSYLILDPNFQSLTGAFGGSRFRIEGGFRGSQTPFFNIEDVILALSGLGYLIAQFRLQSLAFRSVPSEPRIKRKGESDVEDFPRPANLVSDQEIGFLFIVGFGSMLFGQLGWWLLTSLEYQFAIANSILVHRIIGRLLLFIFVLGGAIAISTTIFSYLRWRRMSQEEANMTLQETVWGETRREQERMHRWRKWLRERRGIDRLEGSK